MNGYCWMPIDNHWVSDDVIASFYDNLDAINSSWTELDNVAYHRQCLEEIRSML
jgi:hypothetical protein